MHKENAYEHTRTLLRHTHTRTHLQGEVGAAPLGTLGYVAPERLLALRGPAWPYGAPTTAPVR